MSILSFFFWHDRFCNFLCNTSMGLRQQNLNLWLRRLIFVLLSANEMSISLQAVRTVMTSSSDAQGELDKDLRLMKAVWSAKLSPSLGNWVSCKKAQSLFHGNLRDAPKATPPRNKALIAGLIKGNQWVIVPLCRIRGPPFGVAINTRIFL